MSNASTTQSSSDAQEDTGRGRHRGQTSASDGATAPSGRHRRPVEETESAA